MIILYILCLLYYYFSLQDFPNDVDIWKHQNKHAHTPTGPHPYFDISATHILTQPNDDRGN